MQTYQNELEERGLVHLDEVLLPAVLLVDGRLVRLLMMVELAVLDDFRENAGVDLPHRDFHAVLLRNILQHTLHNSDKNKRLVRNATSARLAKEAKGRRKGGSNLHEVDLHSNRLLYVKNGSVPRLQLQSAGLRRFRHG